MDKCLDVEKGITVIEATQNALDDILKILNQMVNIAQLCSKKITQAERNQYINQMENLKSEIDRISEMIAYHELTCLCHSLQSIDELLSSITIIDNSTLPA